MSETVEVFVGIGVNNCRQSWDTGYTHEEWKNMTEVERDVSIQDCLDNILDVWTDFED